MGNRTFLNAQGKWGRSYEFGLAKLGAVRGGRTRTKILRLTENSIEFHYAWWEELYGIVSSDSTVDLGCLAEMNVISLYAVLLRHLPSSCWDTFSTYRKKITRVWASLKFGLGAVGFEQVPLCVEYEGFVRSTIGNKCYVWLEIWCVLDV